MLVDVNQDCRISVPIFVLLLWQQWSFTFVFLEHNSVSLKIPHFFSTHVFLHGDDMWLFGCVIHSPCLYEIYKFYNSSSYGLY